MSLSDEGFAARTKYITSKSEELNSWLNRLSQLSVQAQSHAWTLHARMEGKSGLRNRKSEILIVDDDSDTCEILSIILKAEHYAVRCVRDKQAALDALQEKRAATILMDHLTPGLDSEGFVRDVRKAYPEICMILMSGMPDLLELAAALQLQLVVAKPVNFDRLMETVEQAERS